MVPNLTTYVLFAASTLLFGSAVAAPDGVRLVRTNSFTMQGTTVSICRQQPGKGSLGKRSLDSHDNQQPWNDTKAANCTEQPTPTSTTSLTTVDLTPARFNTTCYPGTFQAPPLEDCEVVIKAQLYNATGSLHSEPGEYIFVSYGGCATVFQNPQNSEYVLEYNWAELGAVAKKLANRCLVHDENSMGGAAMFKPYLGHTFPDVTMSLQKFDDRDFIIPE